MNKLLEYINKFQEICTILFAKGFMFILFIVGFFGVAMMLAYSPKEKYTAGQKILMYFTGGIFSCFVGSFLLKANVHTGLIAMAGYFIGLLGNGLVVYSLENKTALFTKIFTLIYTCLDFCIDKFKKKEQ